MYFFSFLFQLRKLKKVLVSFQTDNIVRVPHLLGIPVLNIRFNKSKNTKYNLHETKITSTKDLRGQRESACDSKESLYAGKFAGYHGNGKHRWEGIICYLNIYC